MQQDSIDLNRCPWCGTDPLYVAYHDKEWGVPVHDDKVLFEFIVLEGAQAGLSWITVLRKRENYRIALDGFDFHKISQYDEADINRLMNNAGIVRNRLKIESCIKNAKAALKIIEEFGSLDTYFWSFVNSSPIKNSPKTMTDVPVSTNISDALSKDLKKRGFKFVGSTIIYAFMQAVGMVDDHLLNCHKYSSVR
ncbi:MAG TPA: DNA-3-methyladenine glycosylase I [Arenimonas sp.]|nr:DNA-3-methyladenine glycosylase I [Arenimonas sp.]